ncbi:MULTISPECIES: hypothetical protein [unclassified Serratia (in: enterobacteria)]|uniref:hypothetical protein n=1 Tax=unclassified Serratia (in: enterobacteria) TaxID=2647522 RepID=UPI001E53E0C1|nr:MULTISPECIES: hypothetical protein [unclassified Serratia (in: enterobacteria)]
MGNTNAVKHGERSRQAFFTLAGAENFSPVTSLRTSNLIIAERAGELLRIEPHPYTEAWRELVLLDGIMWQHTRRISCLELRKTKSALNLARLELARAKSRLAQAKSVIRSDSKK